MSKQRKASAWRGRLNRAGDNGVGRAMRPLRPRRPGAMALVGLAVAALLAAGPTATAQAATVNTTLWSHLLSVADLPYGWSVAPETSTKGQVTTSRCGAALVAVLSPATGLAKSPLGPTYGTASFVEGTGLPTLRESLASGEQAEEAWQRLRRYSGRLPGGDVRL